MQQKLHAEGIFLTYARSICRIRTQRLRFLERYFTESRFQLAARGENNFDARNQVCVERFGALYARARKRQTERAKTAQIHAFAHQ